jgi:NADH-quinone oxidoreductase subunit G
MSDTKPNEERVTLSIDGRDVSVPKGTTILQAAEVLGERVPHYCYHPGLSAPAQCRLCLVEVEGMPKLQASCVTQVQDGQVVLTQSEKATRMRTGVLEFYLANHPLDCPICDQSGECGFQDYVHAEGPRRGRSREPKRVFGRDDFGGDVLFYGDRCVMCTRCVRFMNEMAQDPRLTVVERGNRSIIDTFFEEGVEGSPWAGNIVDICPVGALVSKDFLHKARAWDLDRTPSICPNCSQGCNIDLHVRDDLVQRLKPRANLDVNQYWMCDYGRDRYEWMNRGGRIEAPLVRWEGTRQAGDWSAVLDELSTRLSQASGPVRAVASPFLSNEDLSAVRRVVDALGGGEVVYRAPRDDREIPLPGFPELRRRAELSPNERGAQILGMERVGDDRAEGGLDDIDEHGGVVLVIGDALADIAGAFAGSASLFVYMGTHPSPAADEAHFVLPISLFTEQEGTFTNHAGRVQRFWPGVRAPGMARPAWLVLGSLVARQRGVPSPERASQAFALAADVVPEFQGLSYDDIGTRGAMVNEPVSLPGAR